MGERRWRAGCLCIILNEQETKFTGCFKHMDKARSGETDGQTARDVKRVREIIKTRGKSETAKRMEARRGMFILPVIM